MRKPRDIDSELKALEANAKTLKERRVRQFGELVIATGADALDAEMLAGALLGAATTKDTNAKEGWRKRARGSFSARHASLHRDLNATEAARRRSAAAQHRLELTKARTGMREWKIKRRERTRQLIELGGLVVKAGLIELTGDDRAMLYGALLSSADALRGDNGANSAMLWRRKGKRAFEMND